MAEAWNKANPKTEEQIRNFYATTDLYIFELMQACASLERRNLHGKLVDFIIDHYPLIFIRKY